MNRLYSALILLEKQTPDLFYLIKKAKIDVLDSEKVTAYATFKDDRFLIVLGKSFIKDFDTFNLAALIEHEALHIILNHLSSEFKELDSELLNICQDAIINDLGELLSDRKKLNEKMQSGITCGKLNKRYSKNFSKLTHSSLDIYKSLKSSESKKELEDLVNSSKIDDHFKGESLDDSSKKELEKFIDSNLNKIESLFKSGKKAGNKESNEILKGILKKKKDALFNKAVNSFLVSNKSNNFKSSFKRLSRRFTGPIKGKINEKNQKILLAIDSSGSMLDPETLLKMNRVISSALSNEFSIDLICGDTKKQGFYKDIKNSFDLARISGGGGTDLGFIFDEKLNNYDGTIVLTDGEFDLKQIKGKKSELLFLLTDSRTVKDFKKNNYKFLEVY